MVSFSNENKTNLFSFLALTRETTTNTYSRCEALPLPPPHIHAPASDLTAAFPPFMSAVNNSVNTRVPLFHVFCLFIKNNRHAPINQSIKQSISGKRHIFPCVSQCSHVIPNAAQSIILYNIYTAGQTKHENINKVILLTVLTWHFAAVLQQK